MSVDSPHCKIHEKSHYSFYITAFSVSSANEFVGERASDSKPFEFGHVREYDFAGDRIWPANTKKKDRIASKSIAVLGYNGLGQ